jgi:pimeloyl-ACP methyl ester carboxylesterase
MRMLPSRYFRAALLAAPLLAFRAGAQAPSADLGPCTGGGLPPEARCGTVRVPENRDRPGGRQLALNVVVIPARSGGPARQALTFFAGGPGQAATPMAGGMAEMFAELRDGRDLLLVDQRGTGRSAPLDCALRDPDDPQSYLGDFLPLDRVAACRDSLARTADLTRYGFPELAHDMDAVRRALGYDRLDLWGGSYGTRAAQAYLRMYPRHVRSVVLHGVVPPGYAQPRDYARDTQAALTGLLAECRADAACNGAFPDVERELREVAARVRAASAQAEILDPRTGRLVRLSLPASTFGETIRRMLYDPGAASTIPFVVHRAYAGDYRPLVRRALVDRRNMGSAWGLSLAILCSEDIPFIDRAAAARDNETTLIGDYRVRNQSAACEGWPRYTPPADYHQPIRTDVPVLVISGALDPVTPASGGERVLRGFANGVHVVVPHAGHGYSGMPGAACVDSLIVRFVQAGSARELDPASCTARIRRPPFVLDVPEGVPVDAAALQRLVGTYRSADPPLEIRVAALEGHVRLSGDGIDEIGVPRGPSRFFFAGGAPGYEMEFSPDASVLTVRTPRATFVLTRTP